MKSILAVRRTTRKFLKTIKGDKTKSILLPADSDQVFERLRIEFDKVLTEIKEKYEEDAYLASRTSGLPPKKSPVQNLLERVWESLSRHRTHESQLIEKVKGLQLELEEITAKHEKLTNEHAEMIHTVSQKEQEITSTLKKLDNAQLREQDYQEKVELLREQVHRLETEIEYKDQIQAQLDAEIGIPAKTKEMFLKERQRLTEQVQGLLEQIQKIDNGKLEAEANLEKAHRHMDVIKVQLDKSLEELKALELIKKELETQVHNLEKGLSQCENELKKSLEVNQQLRGQLSKYEGVVEELKRRVKAVDDDKQSLVTTLNLSKADVSAANDKIKDLTFAYQQLLKERQFLEKEVEKVRQEVVGTAQVQHRMNVSLVKSGKEKKELSRQVKRLETQLTSKQTELEQLARQQALKKKQVRALLIDKDLLNKQLSLFREEVSDLRTKYESEKEAREGLSQHKQSLSVETQELKTKVLSCQRLNHRLKSENELLKRKLGAAIGEIQGQEGKLLKREREVKSAGEVCGKQEQAIDRVKTEQSKLQCQLQAVKQELQAVQAQLRLTVLQREQLKKELAATHQQLARLNISARKKGSEKDAMFVELSKAQQEIREGERRAEMLAGEEARLRTQVVRHEARLEQTLQEKEKVVADSGLLATLLDRRTAELGILYDRVELLDSVLHKGQKEYNNRLDDINILKLEVKKLRSEKELLSKALENTYDLRLEVYHLHKDLGRERLRSRALEQEMEQPANVHRWRLLQGTDPERKDLIDKVVLLSRKVLHQDRQLVAERSRSADLASAHQALVSLVSRMPGPDAALLVHQLATTARQQLLTIKAREGEQAALEEQLKEYKFKNEQLATQMNHFKKLYYNLKNRKDGERIRMKSGALPAPLLEERPRHFGGGFNTAAKPRPPPPPTPTES